MVIRDFLQDKLASFAIPRYISVVSCVHPGGIRTNIARNARFNRAMYSLTREKSICLYEEELFKTTADDAARVIISGIKRNRRRIMVGTDAKIIGPDHTYIPRNCDDSVHLVQQVHRMVICSKITVRRRAYRSLSAE